MKILHNALGFVLYLILLFSIPLRLSFHLWVPLSRRVLVLFVLGPFGLCVHLIDVGEHFVGKILIYGWRLLLDNIVSIDDELVFETRVNV